MDCKYIAFSYYWEIISPNINTKTIRPTRIARKTMIDRSLFFISAIIPVNKAMTDEMIAGTTNIVISVSDWITSSNSAKM